MPSERASSDTNQSSRSRSSGSSTIVKEKKDGKEGETAASKVKDAGKQAVDAAKQAGKVVGNAANSAADALGGWHSLDKYLKDYNRYFYEFAATSFLKKIGATNKASKFLAVLVGLALLQSTVPIFAWPLDFFIRLLSFVFLYNGGTAELEAGFGHSETRAFKVKSMLTAYLITSLFDIVPAFAFDATLRLGALWTFLLPMVLFITPDKSKPKETIAVWIADSVFAQVSTVIQSVIPEAFTGSDQTTTFLAAGILGILLYVGFLGSSGSYLAVYVFLFLQTTNHLGKDYVAPNESSSGFVSQMTNWHNLLAIWLWRYFVSAVEGLGVPGLISVQGWILYRIPSYHLWMTGLFFLMLFTKKTAESGKADTWYARWLAGKSKSSSSSSSGTSSGSGSSSSRPSGSSTSSSRPSGSSSSSSRERSGGSSGGSG